MNYNYITSTIEQITAEGKNSANLKLLSPGTFLMAITGLEAPGTRGSCAILGIEATTNQSCMALLPKEDKITTKFLYYWYLKVGENYGIKYTQGTKQQSYNKELLEKLPIIIPDIGEQNKISEFLSVLNHKIELLEQKYQYYQDFKKYLMQQIFTRKLRFDFNIVKLKDVSKINKGKQLNKEDMLENGEFYVLNGGQEPTGYTNSWNTPENTITISEGGNSCGFVNFNEEKFWSGGHCYYLNNLSEKIDTYYLYSYLKFIEPHIMCLRVGSGLPNIQKGDIENIKIKIAPNNEQKQISNLLLSTDQKISSIKNQKERCCPLFKFNLDFGLILM